MGQLNSFISLFCQMYRTYLKALFKYLPSKGGKEALYVQDTEFQINILSAQILLFEPQKFFCC